MRVVHLLRKFDLNEWGGTESAVKRLLDGLHADGVQSVMYCPRPRAGAACPPENGYAIKYFNPCVPVLGLTPEERRQFVAVGGNLVSFDLLPALWRERGAHLIHSHTLGRLGAMAAAVARRRRVPFVVTIHGGYLDLPARMKAEFHKPPGIGFDWGRLFGLVFRSRQMLQQADAILTCNPTEAALLQEEYPHTRVQVQPHGISVAAFQADARDAALAAWPQLQNREVLLAVGRIDPVKNQSWLVEQAPEIFAKFPGTMLVFAGACTDEAYGHRLKRRIEEQGNVGRILLTGGLAPGDPRLTGLLQLAAALVLPSISETFGIVLLEAWAAGTTVIASRTSGAKALVKHGQNGWLFDLEAPGEFHEALGIALENPLLRRQLAAAGNATVRAEFDTAAIARRTRQLYHQLIEAKSCTT